MSGVEFSVNIGSNETKIVVTGDAGVIHSEVLPVAGHTMDEAVTKYIGQKYKLRIGMKTAEVVKSELGKTIFPDARHTVEVRGRRLIDNKPETIFVSDSDVREALADVVNQIINAVTMAVKSVPAEISVGVAACGITLKGEKGLPENIEQALISATGMAVKRG
jgi:rod shape-determining protein MreB and related proteins